MDEESTFKMIINDNNNKKCRKISRHPFKIYNFKILNFM